MSDEHGPRIHFVLTSYAVCAFCEPPPPPSGRASCIGMTFVFFALILSPAAAHARAKTSRSCCASAMLLEKMTASSVYDGECTARCGSFRAAV